MAKIIKKSIRVLLIAAASLLGLAILIFLLLQIPAIQTYTVNRVSRLLTEKSGAEITVQRVSYSLRHDIVLEGLLLRDLRGDTLLAVRRTELRIREIRPGHNRFRFGRIALYEADFRMIQDSTGLLNLTEIIDSLKGDKERDTLRPADIRFSAITLNNSSYTLASMADTAGIIPGSVNFRDMHVDSINGRVRDLMINRDSVSMVVRRLAFAERGGFTARNVDMNLAVTDNSLSFREVEIVTDSSSLSAERLLFIPRDSSGWQQFETGVRMDLLFNNSQLGSSDLSYFVRAVQGMYERVNLSGRISGTLSEIKGRNMKLEYGLATSLRFDFDVSGLPDINESYLYIGFTGLKTRAADIERISIPGVKAFVMPEMVHDLGIISYRGSFTGFTTDFVSFGTFTTERGTVATDISLRPVGRNTFSFKGAVRTSDADIGRLAKNETMFGRLWGHAEVDGSVMADGVTRKFTSLNATINGVIDSVGINGYLYRNIALQGTYLDKIWDGSVEVKEPNIEMNLLGRFDLEKSLPEFDFTMNLAGADLVALSLVRRKPDADTAAARGIATLFRSRDADQDDPLFRVSALVTANFSGNRMDNLEGNLRLINSTLENAEGKLNIYDLMINSAIINDEPLMTVRSDFADAEVRGHYTIESVRETINGMMAVLLPSRYTTTESSGKANGIRAAEPKATRESASGERAPGMGASGESSHLTFNLTTKRLDRLNQFFSTGLSIAEGSRVSGTLRSDLPTLMAEVESASISMAGISMEKLSMRGTVSEGTVNALLTADSVRLPDRSQMERFTFTTSGRNDTISLTAAWGDSESGKGKGDLRARGFFSSSPSGKVMLTMALLPGAVTVNNTPWSISPARIISDTTAIHFDNIVVSSSENFIRLDGRVSERPDDLLDLSFRGLNIAYLNRLINRPGKTGKESTPMIFEGVLEGGITFSDIYRNLLFESLITINDFRLNNNDYGTMSISSEWDPHRRVAQLSAGNDFFGTRSIAVDGTYSPAERIFSLTATTTGLPLDVINPVVSSFASDLRGTGTGTLQLRGTPGELVLTGAVMARDASMKIDFLQTRYSFTDSIRFRPAGISFNNVRIYDEKRNQGTLNGVITHRSFKDIGVSLDINIDKMMVLNTRAKDNDIFYGTAYATGYAGIRSNGERLAFNISAKTAPNTEFFIPLTSSASVSDYPYIIFAGADDQRDDSGNSHYEGSYTTNEESNIELRLDLEVTPDAEVQLLLDEMAGDVIRAKGEGKLNISLMPKSDVRLAGNYVIREGDYLFTLGNILNKRFAIESGGTVSWNGAIDDANLNIRAIYKTKASLSEIFGEQEFTDLKAKLPVECVLSLSDKLFNPAVSFDVVLPTADETTRELLRAAVDNEEKMSHQFLYLLVMNSFYPDPSLYNSGTTAGAQMGRTGLPLSPGVGVTTTEMLSNQLSNWLSQISNDFDVGFSYRPGNELTDQEMELALSTQLLNDKVIVNGNVDVRGNQSNTQASNISGEFTVEVRLTDMLRFKVFNRSNYNLYYQMHPYTQGVGLFFRRDFNRLADLFIRPDEKKRKTVTEGAGNENENTDENTTELPF